MEQKIKQGRVHRQKKIEKVYEYLRDTEALVFSDYRGLTVEQLAELRRSLRKEHTVLHVHKNKLAAFALRKNHYPEGLLQYLTGPIAIAYVKGDISPVLKTLLDFARRKYAIKIRASYVDNRVFDDRESEMLATLPTQNEMRALLARTFNAPVRSLTYGLHEIVARFARVLQVVADTKK